MKNKALLLLLSIIFFLPTSQAQEWEYTGFKPSIGRYDDVYFHNADLGWTCNENGFIYKTEDGGDNWTEVYSQPWLYFRAIEFINEDIGFAGTLDSIILKTEDGGETWTQIQHLLPVDINGICGLSHIGDNVYGVGYFNYPAYFIKSTDQGQSWSYQDLSQFADGLVECHFVNENVGFVAGIKQESGAVILKTTDGGDNWELVLDTENGLELVWKLDFVTDQIAYGSIESFTGSTRVAKTTNGGDTWEILEVTPMHLDIQGIGFIDENTGWVGPRSAPLYETTDGGQTWTKLDAFPNVNRFFRINSNLIYASGNQVLKYDNAPVSTSNPIVTDIAHSILAPSPNPFSDQAIFSVRIDKSTHARIDLINAQGRQIHNIYAGRIRSGEYQFTLDTNLTRQLPNGLYYLTLRTSEGFLTAACVKGADQ